MSSPYYERHLFFCINERDGERECCAGKNAVAMRDYAKSQAKVRGFMGLDKSVLINPGALIAVRRGRVLWCTRKGSGTPTSTNRISTRLSKNTLSMGALSIGYYFRLIG